MADDGTYHRACTDLSTLRARLAKWRDKLAVAESKTQVGFATFQVEKATALIAETEATIKSLGRPAPKETNMRPDLANEPTPAADSRWPWRAWINLTFGDVTYARGQVIPDSVLEASNNCARLVQGGFVRRAAASTAKKYGPPPPVVVAPHVERDPVRELSVAMRALVDSGTCKTMIDAEGEIIAKNATLWQAGMKSFCERPQTAWQPGMVEGGGAFVPSGLGTSRRILDTAAFRRALSGQTEETPA